MRRDVLANHSRRERVGDGRLESVADLDPELSLLHEHEENQPVVVFFVADLPLLGAADGEVFERFRVERRKNVDDKLCA